MKMPASPPSMRNMRPASMEVIVKLIANGGPPSAERYFHWDDLRRRPTPKDVSSEEWWFALKVARSGGRHPIGLIGTDGRPFSFVTPSKVLSALHRIDVGAGSNVIEADPSLTSADRDRYITRSLVEEAITSSQLEGATTTRLVAKELLRSGRAPRDRSERMILNNYVTMERIRELRGDALTPELVLELHRLVSQDALDDPSAAGRFRTDSENIAVMDEYDVIFHRPPPASELPDRMNLMCDFANGATSAADDVRFVHPALRAIALHFWLAYDHPFVDGNGRTARALFYWSMLRSGYWLFEFVSISRLLLRAPTAYARAFLLSETDDNDLTYFLIHQTDVVTKAIDDLQEYIKKKSSETRALSADLRRMRDLNHRQQAMIGHALRHAHAEYTIEGHKRSHSVAYATARSDLLHLVELGLLASTTRGKTLVFEAAKDLERRLRRPSLPPK